MLRRWGRISKGLGFDDVVDTKSESENGGFELGGVAV